jgi:hypothetical protein
MSDVLIPVVRCRSCGTALFESPSASFEEREPCPACGSMDRDVQMIAAEAITSASLPSRQAKLALAPRPVA